MVQQDFLPAGFAHLAGPLAAHRARMAASVHLPVERLRIARKPRVPPKPVARASQPAPAPSRQFARFVSTTVARDQRLSPSAVRLAVLLVAVAGRAGHVDLARNYVADRLGVSMRTVARLLSQLRACGYVSTVHTVDGRGATTGLRIELLDPLLPFWETEREQGVTDPSRQQEILLKTESRGLAGGWPVLGYPRYRRARASSTTT